MQRGFAANVAERCAIRSCLTPRTAWIVIIVSDTGPLAYLVAIGIVDCLPTLYGQVLIPPSVLEELRHASSPASVWAKKLPDWISAVAPTSIPEGLPLDPGERDAIALALEFSADRVLIDEKQGREAARKMGLKVAGTLAVLIHGSEQQLFNGESALDQLATTNFYASRELLAQVRKILGNLDV